jgi:KAP family P-loop domain
MIQLWSDRPISSAGEDQLGLQPFAASLAKALHSMVSSDGMVVALHAPWGSGKTSALNLVERHLAVLDLAGITRQPVAELARIAAARSGATDAKEKADASQWQHLIEQHASKRRTTVIRFNPWYFSGQESIFKAFFGVLGTALSITNNSPVAKAVAAILRRGAEAGTALGVAGGSRPGRCDGRGNRHWPFRTACELRLDREP